MNMEGSSQVPKCSTYNRTFCSARGFESTELSGAPRKRRCSKGEVLSPDAIERGTERSRFELSPDATGYGTELSGFELWVSRCPS